MIKTTTEYICDLCGKSVEENRYKQYEKFPMITHCDWTGGAFCSPRTIFEPIGICYDCSLKAINIECSFQGTNKHFIGE